MIDKRDNEEGKEEGDSSTVAERFHENFGWLSNAKMVADFEAVSLEQVWDFGVIQFLNDLLYIKLKNEYDADFIRKSTARVR